MASLDSNVKYYSNPEVFDNCHKCWRLVQIKHWWYIRDDIILAYHLFFIYLSSMERKFEIKRTGGDEHEHEISSR